MKKIIDGRVCDTDTAKRIGGRVKGDTLPFPRRHLFRPRGRRYSTVASTVCGGLGRGILNRS